MQIHIINGPNLNLIGRRETEIYGRKSFEEFFGELVSRFSDSDLYYYQSNCEGKLIDKIQEVGFSASGIVLNPGGYSHTSIALADTVKAISSPVIEVHISDIYSRESFRHHSYIKANALETIVGKGLEGYVMAIELLLSSAKP